MPFPPCCSAPHFECSYPEPDSHTEVLFCLDDDNRIGAIVHGTCLRNWLEEHPTCPQCRKEHRCYYPLSGLLTGLLHDKEYEAVLHLWKQSHLVRETFKATFVPREQEYHLAALRKQFPEDPSLQ